jgi:protein O-mannosyl-transferase
MKSSPFSRYSSEIALALILILAAAVFAQLWGAPPLNWDDDSNIFKNPYYHAGMWLPFWTEPYFGLYVPVTSWVWEVLFALGGGTPLPFRILNTLLHSANVVLVFFLLRNLSRRWNMSQTIVLIGTVLFALHPLQVHTVAWISGGRDLLAAFFSLAALLVYFSRQGVSMFSLATLMFLFAILSKPSAVVLPAIVLGLEFILNGKPGKQTWLKMALWGVFALAAIVQTKVAQEEFLQQDFNLFQRGLVVLDTYSFYIQKFFFPFQLSPNYARTPEAALADPDLPWLVLVGAAFLIGLGFLAWKADKRYALIGLWVLALLPVSGVVAFGFQKISTVSDHYMYFPMALVAALVAFILSRVEQPKGHLAVLAVLIPVLTLLSFERVQAWQSNEAFFADMIKTAPDSYATAMGMSVLECQDNKNYEEGVKWTAKALKERPLDIMALANQAYCFLHARNYFRVIELEGKLGEMDLDYLEHKQPTAYSSLLASIGTAYMEQQDYDDGFQFLCEAYRVFPSEPNHLKNLQIAAAILEKNKLNPDCETGPGDEEPTGPRDPEEPVQDVWPDQPQDGEDDEEETLPPDSP